MNSIDEALKTILRQILKMQSIFMGTARTVGMVCTFFALTSAAFNYMINGEGLKESLAKIVKAWAVVMLIFYSYPFIVTKITEWTFTQGKAAAWDATTESNFRTARSKIVANATAPRPELPVVEYQNGFGGPYIPNGTVVFGRTFITETTKKTQNPIDYFSEPYRSFTVSPVNTYVAGVPTQTFYYMSPLAVMQLAMLIAGDCFQFSDENSGLMNFNIAAVLKGVICAVCVIFTCLVAVIDYILAYVEFMFVSSVGIMLLPTSIWDTSKFLSEKFIGAIVGFTLKLLFSTVCIFFLLAGYVNIAAEFTRTKFTGGIDQVVIIAFTSLLYYIIVKNAPGMAQSLLTGSPSLNAGGAISAVAGAVGAATGAAKMAGGVAKTAATGAVRGAFGAVGAGSQMAGAVSAVRALGGTGLQQAGAAMQSLGKSAGSQFMASGSGLVRSLMGGKDGGGGNQPTNRYDQREQHLAAASGGTAAGGSAGAGTGTGAGGQFHQTWGEYGKNRFSQGEQLGLDYMAKQEAKNNGSAEKPADKENA
jgi:type IV secretory pathway TrbL component